MPGIFDFCPARRADAAATHPAAETQAGGPAAHVSIPGRDFDFAELVAAQAAADAGVLTRRGRPVLRLRVDTPDALAWLTGSLARRTT